MGRNKALLPVPSDGRPLVRHVADRLAPLGGDGLIVVANDPAVHDVFELDQNIECLFDRWPDTGVLGGIATGLSRCAEWGAFVACDMPLVSLALFRYLAQLALEREQGADRWDAVVPSANGHMQTVHALYHRRCLPLIEEQLAQGILQVKVFFKDIRVRYVTETEMRRLEFELTSFTNVNTPEEWAAVEGRIR
jgi:molybdopterin-guanine dinucleotide biosynthesis protein A